MKRILEDAVNNIKFGLGLAWTLAMLAWFAILNQSGCGQ